MDKSLFLDNNGSRLQSVLICIAYLGHRNSINHKKTIEIMRKWNFFLWQELSYF